MLVPFRGALIELFLARIQIDHARACDEVVPAVLFKEAGIPEIQRGHFFAEHVSGQDGVGLFFGKSHSAILRYCHALPLQFGLCGSVHQIQFAVLRNSGTGAAAADDLIVPVRDKSDREHIPVHEILGGEMAPVHGAPRGLVGIMLEEKVRFAVIIDGSVRIIGPA